MSLFTHLVKSINGLSILFVFFFAILSFSTVAFADGLTGKDGTHPNDKFFSKFLIVDEPEEGSIFSIANVIDISAPVEGDIGTVSQFLHISEPVKGNLDVFTSSLSITSTISGDVRGYTGHMNIAKGAVVDGDVSVGSDVIIIDGTINGDFIARAKTVVIKKNAVLNGVVMLYVEKYEIEEGATLSSDPIVEIGEVEKSNHFYIFYIFSSVLAAGLLGLIFGNRLNLHGSIRKSPLMAFIIGIVTLVVALIFSVVLIFINIPVGLAALFSTLATLFVSIALLPVLVGGLIMNLAKSERKLIWLYSAVGGAIVSILALIPFVKVIVLIGLLLVFGEFTRRLYAFMNGN